MHAHEYDDVTGEAGICPVDGCWFNLPENDPEPHHDAVS